EGPRRLAERLRGKHSNPGNGERRHAQPSRGERADVTCSAPGEWRRDDWIWGAFYLVQSESSSAPAVRAPPRHAKQGSARAKERETHESGLGGHRCSLVVRERLRAEGLDRPDARDGGRDGHLVWEDHGRRICRDPGTLARPGASRIKGQGGCPIQAGSGNGL